MSEQKFQVGERALSIDPEFMGEVTILEAIYHEQGLHYRYHSVEPEPFRGWSYRVEDWHYLDDRRTAYFVNEPNLIKLGDPDQVVEKEREQEVA